MHALVFSTNYRSWRRDKTDIHVCVRTGDFIVGVDKIEKLELRTIEFELSSLYL